LVSNAPPPVHELWPGSPLGAQLDVTVFSNLVGARKPDSAVYRHACERLGIAPGRCLFIGDGSSGELAGAAAAGMRAVQIRRPADRPENDARFGREVWNGERIASLHLVGRLLAGLS
jgi:putative hydrolase of the HAD superfamily